MFLLLCLGLGDYHVREEFRSQMRPVEDMHLIPAIPMDDIVRKVRSEVDVQNVMDLKNCSL